jgi:glyoxylase-like metal-dependent hydrolase (beta-lactamase superfamily II)
VSGGPGDTDTADLLPAPEVRQIEVGLLENFCELLFCPTTREAAVVDPAFEVDRLLREAELLGVRVTRVLITHSHNDHIDGVEELVGRTGAVTYVHPHEADRLRPLCRQLVTVSDRLDIPIGKTGVRALETFGHTTGGVSYLAEGYVVTGDVLFVRGCGRTDFPGGDPEAMWHSLQRLGGLPEEFRVYPGHNYGPTATSTISSELAENPYLRCRNYEEFRALRERRR